MNIPRKVEIDADWGTLEVIPLQRSCTLNITPHSFNNTRNQVKEILLKIEQVLMPDTKWKLKNFYLCLVTTVVEQKLFDFCSKIQLAYKYKGGQKVYKFDLTSRNIGWKLKSIETTKRRIKRGFLFFQICFLDQNFH